jgi:hypothetical protein
MKKSIFITVALFAFASSINQSLAQETIAKTRTKSNQTNERTAGYDLKKNVKARVVQTDTGCTIVFESSPPSSADAASGMATSKKGYDYYQAKSAYSVSALDNSVTEIKNTKGSAIGQSSATRMPKPQTSSIEYDKSSPKLMETIPKGKSSSNSPQSEIAIDEPGVHKVSNSGQGAGKVNVQDLSMTKVNVQDISFTKRCGGKTTKISCDGDECEIPIGDCPNGDCAITADWSWGMSQSGTMSSGSGAKGMSRCSVDFFLKIEDGACTAVAIKEKGLPGEKKPNTSTTNNPK